jgi:hypothetical protein
VTKIRDSTKKNKGLDKNDAAASSLGVLHHFLQILAIQDPIQVAGHGIEGVNNLLISAKGGPDSMQLVSPFSLNGDIFPSLLGKKGYGMLTSQKSFDIHDLERYSPLRRWIDLALVAVSPHPTKNKDRPKSGLRRTSADSSATEDIKPFIERPFRTPSVNEQNPHSASEAPRIALKSDVLTLGRNVFFPKGVDIYTPKGFGMLTHEITHVQQYDQDAELRRGNVSEFRRTLLEKEALDNEQTMLNYLSRLVRRNRNMLLMEGISRSSSSSSVNRTPLSPFTSNLSGEFKLNMPSIMTSSQASFALNHLTKYSKSDNDRTLSWQNFSRDFLSVLSAANNRTDTSSDRTMMVPSLQSPEKRGVPEMIVRTEGPTNSTMPAMDLVGTPQQPPTSAVPLYAEADRPLTSQPTGDAVSPHPMPSSTNAISYDLDVIVNKVYELFERKIKKERERKGIR